MQEETPSSTGISGQGLAQCQISARDPTRCSTFVFHMISECERQLNHATDQPKNGSLKGSRQSKTFRNDIRMKNIIEFVESDGNK
jgi:hypothetical protein